ncbi:hypothetical protein GGS20DRAFT_595076 [Poronia punctata]|nr:hypothetical protein GGS20DRAFT_595076 [Poronia punctata]
MSTPAVQEVTWAEFLDVSLDFLCSRLERAKEELEREEREATPPPNPWLANLLAMPNSPKFEYQQLARHHTTDDIEIAYNTIENPNFFYRLLIHQLSALAEIDPAGRKKGDIHKLREATECLWAYLQSVGFNREKVEKEINDEKYWKPQLLALEAFQWRKAYDEYFGTGQEPTTQHPGQTHAHNAVSTTCRRKTRPTAGDGALIKPRRSARIAKRQHGGVTGQVGKLATKPKPRNHRYFLRKYSHDTAKKRDQC